MSIFVSQMLWNLNDVLDWGCEGKYLPDDQKVRVGKDRVPLDA